MIFNGDAVISDLWAYRTNFKKAKMQTVQGRIYHSLTYRLTGNVLFEVDGKQYRSGENVITFMPAGVSYKTEVPCDGSMMIIHFRTVKKYDDLKPAFLTADDVEIKTIFAQLCDSYTTDGDYGYKCMALFYSLLDIIDRPLRLVPKRMRLAKSYIDKSFAEEININSLANASGLSDVHFRNEFKKCFGISPLAYVKKVRIDNAKHLLRSGYYSVTEVAIECGFDSISYFSYEFKRLTGKTPTEYIKKCERG